MAFVELTDTTGATVLVNPAAVLFLRDTEDGETELHLGGRPDPLRVSGKPADIARALENAAPTLAEPTLSLLG
ncbi:hypothetical protein [Azospirillum doebereinerae]|uniref:Uncharacterized protein n=1 Tax=Azospirillum doebereinerae TaxID=92933 RepID=A0A433JCJ5_9PROT|nr:hypothetical protein [Azospirillum doebereinerae]RUQ74456.1 hypothetical protein EJ913_05235 [Azospirillum doebereinerae]